MGPRAPRNGLPEHEAGGRVRWRAPTSLSGAATFASVGVAAGASAARDAAALDVGARQGASVVWVENAAVPLSSSWSRTIAARYKLWPTGKLTHRGLISSSLGCVAFHVLGMLRDLALALGFSRARRSSMQPISAFVSIPAACSKYFLSGYFPARNPEPCDRRETPSSCNRRLHLRGPPS